MPTTTYVDTNAALVEMARALEHCDAIGIDTEFERTRTFYARPALLQVSEGEHAWLVDPLTVDDFEPLREILARPDTTKVLHACGEDLEVLERTVGSRPRPLVDTQIAATIVGHGYSLGYRELVAKTLGVELDKGATRSDWLRRPLSQSQLEYAARDAMHLVPMYRLLTARLRELGRTSWCDEECARLVEHGGGAPAPEDYYRRVRQARELDRRELACLRQLCAWREREARARDVARKHVAEDALLVAVARAAPRDRSALDAIQGLPRGLRARHADALIGCSTTAMETAPDELPEPISRVDPRSASRRTKGLRSLVRERAASLGMPPEFILQRRLAEALLEYICAGTPLPAELGGWRRAIIVDDALAKLQADDAHDQPASDQIS